MPRIHDLENHFEALPLHEQRQGKNERLAKEFFSSGKSVFDYPVLQFQYDPDKTLIAHYYANDNIDPIYEWIDHNIKGRWFWHEQECNHGHSLTIDLWFEQNDDIDKFEKQWSTHFKRKAHWK